MDLGNVMALGSLETEPSKSSKMDSMMTNSLKTVNAAIGKPMISSTLAQLTTMTNSGLTMVSTAATAGQATKTIVVVPVSSTATAPGSGDAQPLAKKMKLN